MTDTIDAALVRKRDPHWLLGLAKLRASQIVKLVQLFEDGEIGRDGMLEAVRYEAQQILHDSAFSEEPPK